ncbi:MAG: molybdopterin-dependent oxidoreductase [Candidatus Zixiibacteriota bacterium]
MSAQTPTVTITIDNTQYGAVRGETILQVAKKQGIYIPTLCAHDDLSPHGGCRMCIVEVEGMRNLPTACTTPIENGMIIRTNTAQVQAMRMEILQLFMSEHTASCLVCDEKEDCKRYSVTIRKAGVTTGCRYCPKDGQCELQEVAERLGVKEIIYPIHYRNLRVENEDPFYDRDYNLCILCGRCIRMCQEVRTANVLAFKQRGRATIIGPAFGRSHLDAGCEFCGACVAVCPTGTLREKTRAWEGKPDREVTTTCSFCGVGCQMRLLVKNDRVIGSLPADDALINHGQLCVKGRFCNTELVNGPMRLRVPQMRYNGSNAEISWEKAIGLAAERLSACSPEQFGLLASPNCCNEDLYVAQKFTRVVMGSNNVDTSARAFYGQAFNNYLNLLKQSVSVARLEDADVILCVGLNTRFARSVIGVALRKAVKRGAKIITVHPNPHNLTLLADIWLQPLPYEEVAYVSSLLTMMQGNSARTSRIKPTGVTRVSDSVREKLAQTSKLLSEATSPLILIGTEFMQCDYNAQLLQAVEQLALHLKAGVLPLPSHNNLVGSLLMGSYSELLPGGQSSGDPQRVLALEKKWGVGLSLHPHSGSWSQGNAYKVLYLMGEIPSRRHRDSEFIICQNIYPPDPACRVDLLMPAAASTEIDGTFINGEGRVQRVRKAAISPGIALADWDILCRIARRMGKAGFEFECSADIYDEISGLIDDMGKFDALSRIPRSLADIGEMAVAEHAPAKSTDRDGKYQFVLTATAAEHSHRGFPLSDWVEGSKMLLAQGVLEINPADAQRAGISNNDYVVVESTALTREWPVRITPNQPERSLKISLVDFESVNSNPQRVTIRRRDV